MTSVDDGAETQFLRKMPLPTLKSSSRLKSMLPDDSREGVRRVGRGARGGAAAGFGLAVFELGEVSGRREQGAERRVGIGAVDLPRANDKRQSRREGNGADEAVKRRPRRCFRRQLFYAFVEIWNGVTALVLRQKLILVRAPKTVASDWPATLPPGWKKYWKSGCSVQPGLS